MAQGAEKPSRRHSHHIDLSDTPDVLLSFQKPDGSMSTPRPDNVVASASAGGGSGGGSDSVLDTPTTSLRTEDQTAGAGGDYFSSVAAATGVSDASAVASSFHPSTTLNDADQHNAHTIACAAPHLATHAAPSIHTSSQQASSDPSEGRVLPRRSLTEYPTYPNQAHAALQSQMYPDHSVFPLPTRPGAARIHPLQTSSSTTYRPAPDRFARTAGNTPVTTPGLTTVLGPASRARRPPSVTSAAAAAAADESSPAPSPYLHPVQGHVPKETTRANRDVDTISGRKTINQYEIQYELGRGVHGKVKLARNLNTGEFVAIKIVQRHSRRKFGKSAGSEDKVKREIAILKKTNHPNVVSLIEVIDDPEMTKIYIVLEFCDNHEVQWRTPGSSEIVIMEHRRLERERAGDDDLESADSDRIMRAAQRRRDYARRAKRKPLSRVSSMSEFWSLEFQDESEDEDASSLISGSPAHSHSISAPLSRTTSARADSLPRLVDDDVAPDSGIPDRRVYDAASSQARSNFDPDAHRQALDFARIESRLSLSSSERGRQHSVAESTLSRITEYMEEEIEEEHRYVPTMTLAESRAAFRDAVLGVEYLHYQGVVHRDIKPANLLRKADYRVKISDFGVSYLGKPIRNDPGSEETSESEAPPEHEEDTELAKTVGTPAFYAPELCSLDYPDNQRRVTGQIDVWALGVTLYCLLYARTPFTGDNEFMVMRHIAEDDVFISRKRLKAVDTRSSSRSNSHGPLFRETREHRLPSELVYEDIDEELHDLLRRLFIKDPSKRITLTEIKHHPWVLRDIARPQDWIDETTPHRQLQGKKIEISNDEVRDAVIPLRVIERAKSLARNVAGIFTFGARSTGRKRTQSNASSEGAGSVSSSLHQSDTSSGKNRRGSALHGDVSGSTSSSQSRAAADHHPLSQSVTASPEATERRFFIDEYAMGHIPGPPSDDSSLSRPAMPSRHDSAMSTAASIQTLRQEDMQRGRRTTPPPSLPPQPPSQPMPLSGLEHTVEPRQSISSVLNKAGETLMRTVRSRDRTAERSRSRQSSLRTQDSREQLVGAPSTALATANAAGHVHPRQLSKKLEDSAAFLASRSPNSAGSLDNSRDASTSNTTRTSPMLAASDSPRPGSHMSPISLGGGMSRDSPQLMQSSNFASDREYHDALKQLGHRRQVEDEHERALRDHSRSQSSLGQSCPPSPDDKLKGAKSERDGFFLPLSAASDEQRGPSNPVSSGSSADQLHSNMSRSTSYPSGPSIASANTDYPNASPNELPKDDMASTNSSNGTAQGHSWDKRSHDTLEDVGYTADYALDDDDDSDDSDADLVMMAPKRKTPLGVRSRRESHADDASGQPVEQHSNS